MVSENPIVLLLALGSRSERLRRKVWRFLAIALVLFPVLAACSEPEARFPAEGTVRGIDRESGQVLIAHEKIEGLMDAMTMSFGVADAAPLPQRFGARDRD